MNILTIAKTKKIGLVRWGMPVRARRHNHARLLHLHRYPRHGRRLQARLTRAQNTPQVLPCCWSGWGGGKGRGGAHRYACRAATLTTARQQLGASVPLRSRWCTMAQVPLHARQRTLVLPSAQPGGSSGCQQPARQHQRGSCAARALRHPGAAITLPLPGFSSNKWTQLRHSNATHAHTTHTQCVTRVVLVVLFVCRHVYMCSRGCVVCACVRDSDAAWDTSVHTRSQRECAPRVHRMPSNHNCR